MNYELAKKLKDAGFPDKKYIGAKHYHYIGHPRMGIPHQWAVNTQVSEISYKDYYPDGWLYIPTLSELIEACGDHFTGINKEEQGYISSGYTSTGFFTNYTGNIPEEAVAMLWLELNKK